MLKYASKVRDSKFGGANVIMWFRCDLRIADNPALKAAIESGYNVIPLYIWAPDTEGPYGAAGTASEVWLADSLTDLSTTLRKVGSSLTIRKGTGHLAYFEEILLIAEAFQCRALYFNRRYEQNFKEADADLIDRLSSTGIDTYTYNGSLLYEPSTISLESEQWHGVHARQSSRFSIRYTEPCHLSICVRREGGSRWRTPRICPSTGQSRRCELRRATRRRGNRQ